MNELQYPDGLFVVTCHVVIHIYWLEFVKVNNIFMYTTLF